VIVLWVLGALGLGTLIYSLVGLLLDTLSGNIDWQNGSDLVNPLRTTFTHTVGD